MTIGVALNGMIDALELNDDDRQALVEALAPVPDEHGLRGVWLKSLLARMQEMDASVREPFDAFVARLGKISPFAWIPMSHVVACVVRGATLVETDASLSALERTGRFIASDVERVINSTILRSVLLACGQDLFEFLQVNARSTDMFYNHGEMSVERLDDGSIVMHAEGHHAAADRYLSEGYYQGIADYFGARDARFEIYDPRRYSVIITP